MLDKIVDFVRAGQESLRHLPVEQLRKFLLDHKETTLVKTDDRDNIKFVGIYEDRGDHIFVLVLIGTNDHKENLKTLLQFRRIFSGIAIKGLDEQSWQMRDYKNGRCSCGSCNGSRRGR